VTDLISLGADVGWPDHERANAARERLASSPSSSALGRLAAVAEWVAGVIPGEPGAGFGSIRVIVIGGEPSEAAREAADAAGVGLRVVTDLPDSPADALAAGVQLAEAEAERGTDLIVLAAPGVGADAAIAVSVLTNTEPVKVLSRGVAATDPEAWMALATQVRDGRRAAMADRDDANRLIDSIGSPRLSAIAGLGLQAAIRRTPVVLDGPTAAAGALLAYLAQPRAARWWCAADLGPDALHELALIRLGQRGLLGMGTGLGDGLAGVLVLPLLQAAARLGA
jgi:nicotinate-nucleotide--dimethylbenzimidazole phosphoribosyltransferase